MNEAIWRLAIFAAIFAFMAMYELGAPRRQLVFGRGRRWPTNLGILVIDALVLRVVFPLAAVGAALWAQDRGWGLFVWLDIPGWAAGLLAFVVLDFAIWAEHVAFHKIPIFWRLHRVHHADPDFDVTTGLRFHPVEILLSMLFKAAIVVALGAPPLAVLIFEAVLNGASMFNHSNVRLPLGLDRWLRLVFVTPDMHRVHHSTIRRETDSNYGFNFAFWDRLFRTYVAQPDAGHEKMQIGLPQYRDTQPTSLVWCLLSPFRSAARRGRDRSASGLPADQ